MGQQNKEAMSPDCTMTNKTQRVKMIEYYPALATDFPTASSCFTRASHHKGSGTNGRVAQTATNVTMQDVR